jgi:hypothetical protein
MAADTVKSASITSLDAGASRSVPTAHRRRGRAGRWSTIPITSSMTAAGWLRPARPTRWSGCRRRASLKLARLFTKSGLDSSTGLAIDLGAYYSDSTRTARRPLSRARDLGHLLRVQRGVRPVGRGLGSQRLVQPRRQPAQLASVGAGRSCERSGRLHRYRACGSHRCFRHRNRRQRRAERRDCELIQRGRPKAAPGRRLRAVLPTGSAAEL